MSLPLSLRAAPLLGVLLFTTPAWATWSVIAVDPETREVGVAGATCGPFVWGIAGLSPGHGVVAAQYATWGRGKRAAVDQLAEGKAPDAVLAWLRREDRKPELRQWAVMDLDGRQAGRTGAAVEGDAQIIKGEGFMVQGNTLRSGVVEAAAAAVEAAAGQPLEDRLIAGLVAGAEAGGDKRCSADEAAKSAFLYVAGPDDEAREPTIEVRASGAGAPWEVEDKLAADDMSCAGAGAAPTGWLLSLLGAVGLLWRRRA
ncbi:MAG: hypothetical protein RL071_733 [Pseudomonadota bacterium]